MVTRGRPRKTPSSGEGQTTTEALPDQQPQPETGSAAATNKPPKSKINKPTEPTRRSERLQAKNHETSSVECWQLASHSGPPAGPPFFHAGNSNRVNDLLPGLEPGRELLPLEANSRLVPPVTKGTPQTQRTPLQAWSASVDELKVINESIGAKYKSRYPTRSV